MVSGYQKHVRHCLLFLYEKNSSIKGSEAARELKIVFGADSPTEQWCRKWLALFRDGKKGVNDLDDEKHTGRPTEFDEDRLREVVEQSPRVTVRELAILLDSSIGTIHRHLHAIGKVGRSIVMDNHVPSVGLPFRSASAASGFPTSSHKGTRRSE